MKHPHHDLIVEWAKDTRKKVLGKVKDTGEWVEVFLYDVSLDTGGHYEFKLKPREFQEGHWYPCLHKCKSKLAVLIFSKGSFYTTSKCNGAAFDELYFFGIEESLGRIEFPL